MRRWSPLTIALLLAACTAEALPPVRLTPGVTARPVPTAVVPLRTPAPVASPSPRSADFEVTVRGEGQSGTVLLALRSSSRTGRIVGDGGSRIVEIDRRGNLVWEHVLPEGDQATDVRRLANGNVLFARFRPTGAQVTPASDKSVVEVDRTGRIVREIPVPATTHAEILPGGTLLAADLTTDQVIEVDPVSGREIWAWRAAEHIRPYSAETYADWAPELNLDSIYAAQGSPPPGVFWTHLNSAQRLPSGETVISLRNLDLVIVVDRSGAVVRTFGPLVLKHPHCAFQLPDGNLLVTDNGNARIIEVEWATQRIVWSYARGLYMPIGGCAQRLLSGNTLITDSGNRRVIEVTPQGETVWEMRVNVPNTAMLYRAFWSE